MQGRSRRTARSASRTAWSTLRRCTPGIEATSARTLWPSTTNNGQIRSSVVTTFSRTSRRAHSDLRLRAWAGDQVEHGRGGTGGGVAHVDGTPEFDRHVTVSPLPPARCTFDLF